MSSSCSRGRWAHEIQASANAPRARCWRDTPSLDIATQQAVKRARLFQETQGGRAGLGQRGPTAETEKGNSRREDVDFFLTGIHALEIRDHRAWAKCSARSASQTSVMQTTKGVDVLGWESLGSPHPSETEARSRNWWVRRAGGRVRGWVQEKCPGLLEVEALLISHEGMVGDRFEDGDC
jgi:hypothetical protein